MTVATTDFWAGVLPTALNVGWMAQVRQLVHEAESRRGRADYNTGSILEEEAYSLLALAESITARVIIEVGTFIGTSTTALASASTVEAVYTCDASNDCLPNTDAIRTYPKQASTQMLQDLLDRGVRADLCFFDGALNGRDVNMLRRLTHQGTVYAVHDYTYGPKIRNKRGVTSMETVPRKGIGNVRQMHPHLPSHVLVEPRPGTSLALLVPEHRL